MKEPTINLNSNSNYSNFISKDTVGLILAAGLGTRLKPYTDYIPKPLLPFFGSPIIKHAIFKLSSLGIEDIFINTHHLHEQIEDFINKNYLSNENKDISGDTGSTYSFTSRIHISYEPDILGTGGVFNKIKDNLVGKNIVVYNSDIISNIDMPALVLGHKSDPGRISTMVVTDYKEGTTPLYVRQDGTLLNFGDPESGEIQGSIDKKEMVEVQKYSFCAVSVVSYKILDLIPSFGFSSIIDAYKQALSSGQRIVTYYHSGLWEDIGDKDSFKQAYLKLFYYLKNKHSKNIEIYLEELGL